MKKILSAVLLVVLAASYSFGASAPAAPSVLADAGKGIFGAAGTATNASAKIGKLSTGVHLAWNTATAGYAVMTQHKSGVRKFGTAYDSTAITWSPASKDTVIAQPGSNGVVAVLALGWSVM